MKIPLMLSKGGSMANKITKKPSRKEPYKTETTKTKEHIEKCWKGVIYNEK